MMYFIYNIHTKMFRTVIQLSSGRGSYYKNKIVVNCVTIIP
jgi:hypothetical protein